MRFSCLQHLTLFLQTYSARKKALLDFVDTISPSQDISPYDVPASVLAAMRQTVSNLLGTLPPQFFRVTISTKGDNLAQLMFSVLMTGYMFGSAYTRMQLSQSLGSGLVDSTALVAASRGSMDDDGFETQSTASAGPHSMYDPAISRLAAGAQKLRVEGEVLRWHHDDGVQQIDALEYIEQLEAEVMGLRQLVEAQRAQQGYSLRPTPPPPGNDLLEYLKGLSGEQVAEFTDCATPDVLGAMNALVQRMIGDEHSEGEWGRGRSECTAPELAQLLYWLMAVGHRLRDLEVRLSLHAALDAGPSPQGADDGADGPDAQWVPRLPPGR